jgi:DNA-binding XRE family transcriptional regulator
MHDYIKNLATVVRTAREELGLSQAALAEQIGCDTRTILNIENNRGNPKFEILCQIISYLQISADKIFYPEISQTGVHKQQLLLKVQTCNETEAEYLLPMVDYLLEYAKSNKSAV